MALTPCRECNQTVSTEAAVCPHCGAPQQRPVPPLLPPQEETLYSDNVVTITGARVTIWGTTSALRNVTSVRMAYTPRRIAGAVLLLVIGVFILLLLFLRPDGAIPPVGVYFLAGGLIGGAILWMLMSKTHFHVALSTAAGELHVLTSKDKAYIQRVVQSINDAIAKYR